MKRSDDLELIRRIIVHLGDQDSNRLTILLTPGGSLNPGQEAASMTKGSFGRWNINSLQRHSQILPQCYFFRGLETQIKCPWMRGKTHPLSDDPLDPLQAHKGSPLA